MKTVLITGANGNLGSTVTKEFLDKGYRVVATVIAENMKSDKPGPFRVLRSGVRYSLYLGESSSILNHPMIHFSEGLLFVEKNTNTISTIPLGVEHSKLHVQLLTEL